MSVTNVRSEWKNGHLVFRTHANNGQVITPKGAYVHRQRFTVAEVNAGAEVLPALPGFRYRMQDMALIATGGGASGATSVDILGTQATVSVKLMDGRVAGLTDDTLLRAGTATNGVILAEGASFTACDANTPITINHTAGDVATSSHIDVLLTYTIEEA